MEGIRERQKRDAVLSFGGQEARFDPVSDKCAFLPTVKMNPGLPRVSDVVNHVIMALGKIHRLDDCRFFHLQALYSRDFGSI